MKLVRWIRSHPVDRWYARNYLCPVWGHKDPRDGSWEGKFDKIAGTIPKCELCGEVIEDGGAPGRVTV